jgi:hypothetical protein
VRPLSAILALLQGRPYEVFVLADLPSAFSSGATMGVPVVTDFDISSCDNGVPLAVGSALWMLTHFSGVRNTAVPWSANESTFDSIFAPSQTSDQGGSEQPTILPTTSALLGYFAIGCAMYVASLVIYRLYLSPIAHIPGPFLARVTHWYEFYHNFVRIGKYYEVIEDMHRHYGTSTCH